MSLNDEKNSSDEAAKKALVLDETIERFNSTSDAEAYLHFCKRFDMPVDNSVLVGLKFECDTIQISSSAPYEGCLLPLYPILARSKTISRVNLHVRSQNRMSATGNSNALVLGKVLAINDCIRCVDLRYAGLDSIGAKYLCEGLRHNSSIHELLLAGNFLGREGGRVLCQFFAQTGLRQMRFIDLSCCNMGYHCSRALLMNTDSANCAVSMPFEKRDGGVFVDSTCKPRILVKGNFVTEEVWNSVSHGFALIVSIVGIVVLLYDARMSPTHHLWGIGLFCIGLFVVFLFSTLYHSLFLLENAQAWFQILDHCSIYIMIAGSYSPLMLFYPLEIHLTLLCAEWWLCLGGVVVHVISRYHEWGGSTLYSIVELALYVTMGCSIFYVWDTFSVLMPPHALNMLCLAGMSYIGGIPFFVYGDYLPILHAVWHVFVFVAAIFLWFAVDRSLDDAFDRHQHGQFDADLKHLLYDVTGVREQITRLFQSNISESHSIHDAIRQLEESLWEFSNST